MRVMRFAIVAMAILTVFIVAQPSMANVGQIIGTILDEKSGEPLIGASVQVEGTSIGAAADIDGRYVIRNVPHGTHSLLIASLGYTPKRITEVAVTNGEPVMIDASLGEAVTELKPIEVTAERARATESSVLIKRRGAVNVTDGVSAELIKKSGDSHAGDALRRVVGVTVVDGKKLVVRGMGGRYSNVQLNGAPLPSPEPERREVPLDLFPGSLLDEIVTSKTFTPDMPGNFSGGSVDLTTKEFPNQLSYSISSSGTYNSVTTGQRMLSSNADKGIPAELQDQSWAGTDSSREAAGEAIAKNPWTPTGGNAPLNSSYGFTAGNRFALGERQSLGIVASVTHSRSYSVQESFYSEYTFGDPSLTYNVLKGVEDNSYGGIGSATLSLSENHKLAFKSLYSRNEESESRHAVGVDDEWGDNEDIRVRFIRRDISSLQLTGEHNLPGLLGSSVRWRAASSDASRDDPLSRSNFYQIEYDDQGKVERRTWRTNGYSGAAMFMNLDDDDAHGAIDWSVPLGLHSSKFKFGTLFQNKTRQFQAQRYRFVSTGGQTPRNDYADLIFTPENIGPNRQNQYRLESGTFADDRYNVNEHTLAGYAMAELAITSRLRVIGGARHETYDMELVSGNRQNLAQDTLIPLRTDDWLPMVSAIVGFSDRMNIRAVFSQTLARPEFREFAPFSFQDLVLGRPTEGNPDLVSSYIKNYDFRWEYFPAPNEILAVSFFWKTFEDPIERHVKTGSSRLINTLVNSEQANNQGVEFEARKSLGFLGEAMSRITLGGSLALVESEVTIKGDAGSYTENRPLTGQSPYVVNLVGSYITPSGKPDITVLYNAFGDRVISLDVIGQEPYYEETRHSIDMTIGYKFWESFALKFGARNLLGEDYVASQKQVEGNNAGQTMITEKYEIGRSITLGLSYGI